MKKAFVIILALIPVVFWLVKVANVVEVEQHNDRADFNNAVVGVLNDLGDDVTGTEELLLQYTQLDQFDESQQRGMWFLIEDMEFDYQPNIDSATERLQGMLVDADEAALNLLLTTEFDALYTHTSTAINGFESARQTYLDGN